MKKNGSKFHEIRLLVEQASPVLRSYIEFLEKGFNEQARQIEEQARQIEEQARQIEEQTRQITALTTRVKELEGQIAKNSSNSGKPPSSDGQVKQRKTQSSRTKTGKKRGGQLGRSGKTLEKSDHPDYIIEHADFNCHDCGHSLDGVIGECVEVRQVFDIPEPQMLVTEHRLISKNCPCCAAKTKGSFPERVTAHVQYGDRARSLMVYLNNQHMIPFERISQFFEDLYGRKVSPATVAKANVRVFQHLELFETELKAFLVASSILHFDETGIRCQKKTRWIHVGSSLSATLYHAHEKRGRDGMIAGGVIGRFTGIGIHDGLKSYFSFENMTHGLCNAHHLRELKFIHEHEGEEWANQMRRLLLRAKEEGETYREIGRLPQQRLIELTKEYASIALGGLLLHSQLPPLPRGERGRRKQRPGKNLLDRLSDGMENVLRYVKDLTVPFTNNLAEQDLRMIKVQQKVSGCFREPASVTIFCRIRSCISTARKQGWSILTTLTQAVQGKPLPPLVVV